jgi:hypothetical protein
MTSVKKVKKPLIARIEGAFVDMFIGPVEAVCRSLNIFMFEIEGILTLYFKTPSQIHKESDLADRFKGIVDGSDHRVV